jgi:tetraacyldisaccharide 4'-kinase
MNPLEALYYFGYRLKKRSSLGKRRELPCPVVSVGNITVGGTGKTPAVVALAEEAALRGYQPVILTRGYRGEAADPCFVSRGKGPELSAGASGDEPAFMAERLPGAVIVKSADRYAGGMFALGKLDMGGKRPLFILDDGFQRWDLARDVDIVLVDGIKAFGNRRLIPLGGLREPLGELGRADILIVTKARNSELAAELRGFNPSAPLFYSEYVILGLYDACGGYAALDCIRGKRVFAFCGVANPASFRETLRNEGLDPAEFVTYRDHYQYAPADIDGLVKAAQGSSSGVMLTTEKDMVKIKGFLNTPQNLYALRVDFGVDRGFFDEVFGRLQ